ncbi:DUF805 domain-containing protein [Sphingomonas sp. SUN039]|uniref:DUF805 domain-containing protein n=1 Tax=Sphingomonas sp. SUN039 TaxID=2937787 RepID=UPI002164C77F|nr:DUF805 domain-containing protein [Sphingomonas sp. SUN039]UVO53071.1 DUF805 domain-containing protein [Sphingomonas sp. SUN039]
MEWMIMPLKRYAEFSGRSRRKEYWMFFLFNILVGLGFLVLMLVFGGAALFAAGAGGDTSNPAALMAAGGAVGIIYLLNVLFSLAMLIPSIAVGVRRLHDTDRRGWWLLAPLAPYVAIFVLSFGMIGMAASGGANETTTAASAAVLIGICGLAVLVLGVMLLVFMCLEGTRGPNRFGPDPKDPGGDLETVFS